MSNHSSPFDDALSQSFEFRLEHPQKKKWSFSTTATSSSSMSEALLSAEETIDYEEQAPQEQLFLELETIDLETGMLNERRESINEINQSMKQLNSIQKDLAGIVAHQGIEVERMAYMSIEVFDKTEEGAQHIRKTYRQMKQQQLRTLRRRGLFLTIFLVMVVAMGTSWRMHLQRTHGSADAAATGTDSLSDGP